MPRRARTPPILLNDFREVDEAVSDPEGGVKPATLSQDRLAAMNREGTNSLPHRNEL